MASTVARDRCGFSRIEVCVVLIGLALLAAIGIPATLSARESARRTECKNNLKSLGFALNNYHDVYSTFPYGCVGNPALPPEKRWSWYLCIGNYMQKYGTPLVDYARAWNDPALRPLKLHIAWFDDGKLVEFDVPLKPFFGTNCPNGTKDVYPDGQPYTEYVGIAGLAPDGALLPRNSKRAGAWAYDECSTIKDIKDGTSTTLFIVETSSKNGCWIAGGPATVRQYSPDGTPIGRGKQFGGLHSGGAMAVFVDGHVSFLADGTDPGVFSSLLTIAGSETMAENAVVAP